MEKNETDGKSLAAGSIGSSNDSNTIKSKPKSRGKKRKRRNSGSSSEHEDILPENAVDVDRSLHASAIKNNLDETSVRKIIKKVVTNDRVLALVKMREEEDSGPEENRLRPKLTRAKVKELMKVSPKTTAWNLENLELTPIKHIPVKTRPEVKALIAQELPEDEDDEEYEPTHDDVPSDDDQGLESCSDLDSQPRTPATPHSLHSTSPKIVTDGPFKVPQDISTPTRRKLNLEEEATIALRTRSKLSLSATSIEHIESTFVPPDDIPMPAVDDLWNEFLNECLNPASTSKNEDDDETDPEYNVAADPDAHDEDEEALGNSIIKISKKELNDLVTELFNIMPESTVEEELMADDLASSVLTERSQTEVSNPWEGKQEPLSDEESGNKRKFSDRITFEKKNYSRVSSGKTELSDVVTEMSEAPRDKDADKGNSTHREDARVVSKAPLVEMCMQEQQSVSGVRDAPAPLRRHLARPLAATLTVRVDPAVQMLPEQVQILQQQLRQHIQLATSSYLQLFVHPIHWKYAPKYKEYLESFSKMVETNPRSVVNVCNLKPAVELVSTWEDTVAANTQENREMIEFIQSESDRCLRRGYHKNLYVGEFHDTFKKVVANSPVFLYPYLLPAMPFRGDHPRRFCYLLAEDELIAMGLEQFWQYVLDNPEIYKPTPKIHGRWGLSVTVQLIIKHMFPWIPVSVMHSHIQHVRKGNDKDNPINKFFLTRTVSPVKHKLLPYNPALTLYEQPEHELPRIWVRYLAKTSKRFRSHLMKRTNQTGLPPVGVDVELGHAVASKAPVPIDYTLPAAAHPAPTDNIQIANAQPQACTNLFKLVETSTGAFLLPLKSVTVTVNSNTGPIATPTETTSNNIPNDLPETSKTDRKSEHCSCCVLLRKICKQRQTVITDYFGKGDKNQSCDCRDKRYPKISNRLRILVNNYKFDYTCALQALQTKMKALKQDTRLNETEHSDISNIYSEIDDIAFVTRFQLKFLSLTTKSTLIKRKLHTLLSKFNPYEHDALQLLSQIDKIFGNELVDMHKEFLGFLTPHQADQIDAFKDYFIRNCVTDLVKKVEELVTDREKRFKILEELHSELFTRNLSTACEICTRLLATLDGYPDLARYVHSLFPHRKEKSSEKEDVTSHPTDNHLNETACEDSTMVDNTADYEADQSMSEDEENGGDKSISELEVDRDADGVRPIKTENTTEEVPPATENVTLVITVNKTELQDSSDCSNSSLKIVCDDQTIIKSESPEWKRDEDKLILEVFKQQMTPEERVEKSIVEIIEEKNIVGIISESLIDKSEHDIRTRLMYLLQVC